MSARTCSFCEAPAPAGKCSNGCTGRSRPGPAPTYGSNAERQAAYRQRKRLRDATELRDRLAPRLAEYRRLAELAVMDGSSSAVQLQGDFPLARKDYALCEVFGRRQTLSQWIAALQTLDRKIGDLYREISNCERIIAADGAL